MTKIVTHWEEAAPLPPDALDPFAEYGHALDIEASEFKGFSKITFTGYLDNTIFYPGPSGATRAIRAWANAWIELRHWKNIVSARNSERMTFPPSWPVSVHGVRQSQFPDE